MQNKVIEKLTPAYGVFYILNNVKGYNVVWIETDRKNAHGPLRDWCGQVKPFVEPINVAIKKAKKLTNDMPDNEIYVEQVGFIERGFKPEEEGSTEKVYHYIPIKKKANWIKDN